MRGDARLEVFRKGEKGKALNSDSQGSVKFFKGIINGVICRHLENKTVIVISPLKGATGLVPLKQQY